MDVRDGVVYFGCKKSVKVNQTNLDMESTTIVKKTSILTLIFVRNMLSMIFSFRVRMTKRLNNIEDATSKSSLTYKAKLTS